MPYRSVCTIRFCCPVLAASLRDTRDITAIACLRTALMLCARLTARKFFVSSSVGFVSAYRRLCVFWFAASIQTALFVNSINFSTLTVRVCVRFAASSGGSKTRKSSSIYVYVIWRDWQRCAGPFDSRTTHLGGLMQKWQSWTSDSSWTVHGDASVRSIGRAE